MTTNRKVYQICIGKIAEIEWLDSPDLEDLKAALQAATDRLGDPIIPLMLIDFSTDYDPPTYVLKEVAQVLASYIPVFGRKIALVVKKDVHYGLGRMLNVFCETQGFELLPFRNIEKARKWLESNISVPFL